MSSSGTSSSIPRIQVFRPTMEEFKNFSKYIEKIESTGAQKAGLAKIIPPEEWTPRKNGYDDVDLIIPAPISQVVNGCQGLYQQFNIQKKAMTVKEFKKLAEGPKYKTPAHFDYEDLERKYWKNIAYNSPIYGADVSGSLYDEGVEEFNIQHLNTILDLVKEDYEIQIEGVNTAYLYFGMWKTTFAWHTEDMDLYSINYLHFGAPKSWYAIPPEHGRRLERLAANFFHGSSSACPAFLRHKMTIISPQILKRYCIPFNKITQEPGEFMITFPFGYHSGFNHGFNCAESTNFALPRWVEYGKRAISCTCRNDCVKICMEMFVRKFQPDRYELWKEGKDIGPHPEDPTRHYAAPAPKRLELALAAQREERKKAKMLQASQKIKRLPISKVGKNGNNFDFESEGPKSEDDKDNDSRGTEIYEMGASEEGEEDQNGDSLADSQDMQDDTAVDNDMQDDTAVNNDMQDDTAVDNDMQDDTAVDNDMQDDTAIDNDMQDDTAVDNDMQDDTAVDKDIAEKNTNYNDKINSNKKVQRRKMYGSNCIEKMDFSENPVLHQQDEELEMTVTEHESSSKNGMLLDDSSENILPNKLNEPPVCNPQKVTKTVAEDIFSKFPALQKAISSGALQFTCIPTKSDSKTNSSPNSFSSTLMPSTNQIISPSPSSRSISPPELENYILPEPVPFTHNVSPKSNTNPKKLCVSVVDILPTKWKCEQTQGLKVKLAKQCQPNNSSSDALTLPSSTSTKTHTKKTIDKTSNEEQSDLLAKLNDPLVSSHHNTSHQTVEKQTSDSSENNNICAKSLTEKKKNTPPDSKKIRKRRKSETGNKAVKSAQDTPGNWAQPVLKLWQHFPPDFEEEQRFNVHCSTVEPHCAVCIIFSAININSNYPNSPIQVPNSSKVKMPAFCFGNGLETQMILDSNPLLSRDGTSPLLVCSVCKVCVHATCYGVTMLQIGTWTCARCLSEEKQSIQCCLCVMRGGALKPTNDSRWAHILCAILIPETYFDNTIVKQPVNVSHLTANRQRLKCRYCLKKTQHNRSGACVQCLSGKCYLPFHVTCGYLAGVIYDVSDWPDPLNISCTRHSGNRRKPKKRAFTNIETGDKVLAKHKRNKRYYWVVVRQIYFQEYYSVLFDDNSTSTNTLPEDIVDKEIREQSTPKMNEKIKVKWTDGVIYNAIFKGSRSCKMHIIEFDDGTLVTQERHQIYASDENIPKEILSKVGTSAESRFDLNSTDTGGKRIRVSNSKYMSD